MTKSAANAPPKITASTDNPINTPFIACSLFAPAE